MKYCPNCHANIDGLTHHCDCCGALLNPYKSPLIWHVFVTSASGDLSRNIKNLFQKLNSISISQYVDFLSGMIFEFYCYPKEMIRSLKIKGGVYYSHKRKTIKVKIVLDYDLYINSLQDDKKIMVITEIKKAIICSQQRLERANIFIDNFWRDVEVVLQDKKGDARHGTEARPD